MNHGVRLILNVSLSLNVRDLNALQTGCMFSFTILVFLSAKHPRSCNEIRLNQLKGSGDKKPINQNYTIDPDGSGPIKPFLAFCNMTHGRQLDRGITVVRSYDHHVEVRVADPNEAGKPESFIRDIRYYPDEETAKAVAMQSEECRQYIEYSCINSKLLNNGNPIYGRWVSARNKHEKYWGGAKPDSLKCACGVKGTCVDKTKGCNCDAGKSTLEKDYGYLTDTRSLPVTQVLLGDVNPQRSSQANVSVGDLYCSGMPCIHILTPSAPASSSVCKLSLYCPHRISCLVMRVKQMILHSNLSKMRNKTLQTCLHGNYKRQFRRIQQHVIWCVWGWEGYQQVKTDWGE